MTAASNALHLLQSLSVAQVHEALCAVHQQREQARQARARRRAAAAAGNPALEPGPAPC